MRLSLLGGNTDFPAYFKKYGGACLATTIDKYVYCIVKKRFDDEIWINYSRKEKVKRVEDIKHDLVREALRLTGVHKGIEITFLSDIPSEGSGLGSSSAVVIGLLNALHTYKNDSVDNAQLISEALRIEIAILKKPIGYQDQIEIASGGFNFIEFNQHEITVNQLNPEDLGDNLMLLYTGITRKAESVLSKMNFFAFNTINILDEIKLQAIKKLDHITDAVIMGEQLNRYWELKKKLNKAVTNSKIEKMYSRCLKAGALGGKIVGAGAGGFLLLAVMPKDRQAIRDLGYKELPFKFSNYGSQVIFNINE